MSLERRGFHDPEEIFRNVREKVEEAKGKGERIDYLTFVPDGEPTLDLNLGTEIALLRAMKIPIAILTNGSLLWRPDVREDLLKADLVSVKVDALSENLWRKINKPHRSLKMDEILDGITEFSKRFKGNLITETMLVDGLDYVDELEKIADFLSRLKVHRAYIAIPTRPPAERSVRPADERVVNMAFQVFSKKLGEGMVEYLIGYEGNAFAFTGNVEEDLLSITSVHASWEIVEKLLDEGKLIELEYENHRYYMRKIPSRIKP